MEAERSSRRRRGGRAGVEALAVPLAVLAILLTGSLAGRWLGTAWAGAVSFLGAALVVWCARSFGGPRLRTRGVGWRGWAALPVAAGAGFLAWPGLVAVTWTLGTAIGLTDVGAYRAPPAVPPEWYVAALAAPAFEEPLYRERVLLGLRGRLGSVGAVAASTLAFAVTHVRAWAVLGTLVAGAGLGGLAAAGASLTFCVALHVGLNLAALAQSEWGFGHDVGPFAALVPAVLLGIGWSLDRGLRCDAFLPRTEKEGISWDTSTD